MTGLKGSLASCTPQISIKLLEPLKKKKKKIHIRIMVCQLGKAFEGINIACVTFGSTACVQLPLYGADSQAKRTVCFILSTS